LRPIAEVFSATDDDLERLQKFNQSSQSYAQDARIESLISRQSALTPDATAVVSGNERLTYRDLEERSDAVAQALIGRGVGPGQLAGMACGRNIHMLPAMLGILKSGAAYVPLDPSLPEERLTYMCSDAEIRCVVADRSAPPGFSGLVEPVFVDDLAAASDTIPQVVDPMGAAYVIYTSGSTGKPKGVVVPHRAVVNFLNSMAREPGLSALDRLVAVTTTSFDIAVLELFLPLTVGAQVIIADRDTVLDGGSLRNLIEKHEATVVQATPAGWRLLVDAGWTGGPGFKALVGGEALPEDLASELFNRAGSVWNMYGPTETTVWSTCWKLTSDRKGIRIGRPIANTDVWILDESLKPCPIGVPGEIFIGGDGVTTGYWRRPELTAERFVMFEGRRIYRTGDRGRWRNDGTLEHLGRLDFQVKVRGYRIELGEIESNLIQLGDIDRAVVLAREDEPGDVRLVAYVVSGTPIEAKTVRSSLRKSLPDYMIPGHIMQLPAIPLLPNGKVDRKSLPKPTSNKAVSVHPSAGPATELEARVLHDFESVLKLSGIGLDDDFFALGGHSLLAAELAHRLAKVAGRRVPLRAVFDAPTVRKMSAALSGTAEAQPAAAARSIPVQPDQSTAPLTTMQQGIYLAETMYPGRVTNNAPSAHRLRGPFNAGAFRRALEAMMARQPILRTSMFKGPDGAVQRVENVTDFPLIEEDLSALPEGMREKELMARMQAVVDRPIDIHAFPLFRAVLYRLKPEEHVFLFMPHHIIWDGWSFDILYDELDRNYPDALAGSVNSEPLSISYVDFAHWHHHWLQGAEYKAQLAYWKTQLERSAQMRPLPTDRLRKRTNESDTGTEWIMIDKPAADAVHDLAGKIGATANLIVMAIHALQLSEATNGPAVALGMTMRGRTDAVLEPVMGLFVNVVPVLIGIDPAISLREHVQNVRNVLIEAIGNQEVPFEHLSADPAFQAYQSRAGAFQSMYSFQDARARRNAWGPLQHSRVSVMQKDSPADFGLWLIEVPEGMQGAINYRTSLWDQSTAQLFKERFLGLIERAVANPEATLGELLSSPGEDRAGMAAWVRSRDPDAAPSDTPRAAGPHAVPAASNVTLERKLAQIWADLLGLDAADIHAEDNFFDLGGNSLLVMRAVEQSRQQLGLVVEPHRYVYETVRLLSVPATAEPEPGASSQPEQAMRTPRVAGVVGKG
jgi:amino acid adenylation domain-containing protein